MKHYLCITNDLNWDVIREKEIWAVPYRQRKKIMDLELGDILVFYVKQKLHTPPRLVGIFTTVSTVFEDHEKIFGSRELRVQELFPYRVKIKPVLVPKEPVPFKDLIPKLDFIKNKKAWFGYLMGRAMLLLSEKDYKLIESSMKAA